MKLLFEKGAIGRKSQLLEKCDVECFELPARFRRAEKAALPQLSEIDVDRHYSELNTRVHGVNTGFYPLGSCTMKYNPR
ncbi:MAG: aminomethyl-transferring glycine dehydrogenase subunit GcvPB, partial [Firmicutes bacterium]|nr:aminomethyl-transferring glycine dehydrogenase subunit GcvPB [Bacillota bacterium]